MDDDADDGSGGGRTAAPHRPGPRGPLPVGRVGPVPGRRLRRPRPGSGRWRRRLVGAGVPVAVLALAATVVAARHQGDPFAADPVPSAGCGSSTVAPGVERLETTSGGLERWYRRSVPAGHDGRQPVPVVVDLHGYGSGADGQAESSQLEAYGAVEGFVTVTPQGQGDMGAWDPAPGSRDVVFVGELLDQVEQSLCVDAGRLFVTGSSNGAMLASTLACETSHRIAAVAAVAGVAVVEGCEPERPVPILAVHGTGDTKVRYDGGLDPGVARLPLPDGSRTIGDVRPRAELSIPEVMAWWAAGESCGTEPQRHRVSADTVLLRYPCPGWTAVELYRIDGGGHTWPGRDVADATGATPGPDSPLVANDVIWRFFEDHPLSIAPSWETLTPRDASG